MKEYKVVYLNKDFKFSRDKAAKQVEDAINEYVAEGWTLQQVVAPDDDLHSLVGIFYREK